MEMVDWVGLIIDDARKFSQVLILGFDRFFSVVKILESGLKIDLEKPVNQVELISFFVGV